MHESEATPKRPSGSGCNLPAGTAVLTYRITPLGYAQWSVSAVLASKSLEAVAVKGPETSN